MGLTNTPRERSADGMRAAMRRSRHLLTDPLIATSMSFGESLRRSQSVPESSVHRAKVVGVQPRRESEAIVAVAGPVTLAQMERAAASLALLCRSQVLRTAAGCQESQTACAQ